MRARLVVQAALALAGVLTSSLGTAQLTGVVRNSVTLDPISNAIVSVQATRVRTTTGPEGQFALPDVTGQGLVVVAAMKGFINGSKKIDAPASGLSLQLEPVPQGGTLGYSLQTPDACGDCHPDQLAQWTDSPMARAGLNSWVYDIYDGTGTPDGMGGFVYLRDSAHAGDNPNSECASCHQPESWLATPFSALVDITSPSSEVLHGVSCEVCHKIGDVNVGRINFPGLHPDAVTWTRPQPPSFDNVEYGVLADTDFDDYPADMRPSYQPQLVAEVCGTCHQDKNDPDGNGDFEEANGIISEPTYLEWLASPYGDPTSPLYASCVDCHMPPTGADSLCIALVPPLIRDPATIRSHTIEGTTPAFLENAALLELDVSASQGSLDVSVSITNDATGHHLPTGVTVRNMILLVDAWRVEDDAPLTSTGNQTVHALGGSGDPAAGYYAGLPGKLYAKVNHDANDQGPTFFTDATGIRFDNRIPALSTDATEYRFELPAQGGDVQVGAVLIYRRAFRFLVDAKQWTQTGHGTPLADVQPPHFGHLMEEAYATVTVPEPETGLLMTAALLTLGVLRRGRGGRLAS